MVKGIFIFVVLFGISWLAIGSPVPGARASRFVHSKLSTQRWRFDQNVPHLNAFAKQVHRRLGSLVDNILFHRRSNGISAPHLPTSRHSLRKVANPLVDETSNQSRIFFPKDEGADPTGTIDST
eukprot:c54144_g1_i1 orf=1-369(-)